MMEISASSPKSIRKARMSPLRSLTNSAKMYTLGESLPRAQLGDVRQGSKEYWRSPIGVNGIHVGPERQ